MAAAPSPGQILTYINDQRQAKESPREAVIAPHTSNRHSQGTYIIARCLRLRLAVEPLPPKDDLLAFCPMGAVGQRTWRALLARRRSSAVCLSCLTARCFVSSQGGT